MPRCAWKQSQSWRATRLPRAHPDGVGWLGRGRVGRRVDQLRIAVVQRRWQRLVPRATLLQHLPHPRRSDRDRRRPRCPGAGEVERSQDREKLPEHLSRDRPRPKAGRPLPAAVRPQPGLPAPATPQKGRCCIGRLWIGQDGTLRLSTRRRPASRTLSTSTRALTSSAAITYSFNVGPFARANAPPVPHG